MDENGSGAADESSEPDRGPIDAVAGDHFEEYRPWLRREARILTAGMPGLDDGTSDLVQSALIRAYQSLFRKEQRFDDEAALRSWLRTILRNKVLDAYRTRHARVTAPPGPLPPDDLSDRGPTPSAVFEKEQRMRDLVEVLARLNTSDMLLINWYFGDGLTYAEIGRRLECSDVWASKLVKAALVRVRDGLAGSCEVDTR